MLDRYSYVVLESLVLVFFVGVTIWRTFVATKGADWHSNIWLRWYIWAPALFFALLSSILTVAAMAIQADSYYSDEAGSFTGLYVASLFFMILVELLLLGISAAGIATHILASSDKQKIWNYLVFGIFGLMGLLVILGLAYVGELGTGISSSTNFYGRRYNHLLIAFELLISYSVFYLIAGLATCVMLVIASLNLPTDVGTQTLRIYLWALAVCIATWSLDDLIHSAVIYQGLATTDGEFAARFFYIFPICVAFVLVFLIIDVLPHEDAAPATDAHLAPASNEASQEKPTRSWKLPKWPKKKEAVPELDSAGNV